MGAQLAIAEPLAPPTPATPYSASSEEWIELHNRGDHAVDLTGWSFEQAIRFEFPVGTTIEAGQYLVVAKNRAHVQRLHPDLGPIDRRLCRHSCQLR